LEIGQLDRLEN